MKKLTPMMAIRAKCVDCCCRQLKEIRLCEIETCSLWPYRMGHRPGGTTPTPNGVRGKNRTLNGDFQEGGAS
ncbi:MAG: hypothetical protein NTY53_25330 [Kiritimatiellaeota bacterium]|nr:hypothetical protein [Kiritimatiellota bacterium]